MTAERRIVVGIDGSQASRRALRRAAEEAEAHRTTLEVLWAWSLLDQETGAPFDPNHGEASVRADLEQLIAEELGERPLPLVVRVENDLPARALVAAAEGAWLVVVGSRGRGGVAGLVLGSVSSHLAHHSPCPVLIVRGANDDAPH